MKNIINTIFTKAKNDFLTYLNKKDPSLLEKGNSLFDLEVTSINSKLLLIIELNESKLLLKHEIDLNDLENLSSIIQQKVKPYGLAREYMLIKLFSEDIELFTEVLPLNKLKNINNLLEDKTNTIYSKIGKLDINLKCNDKDIIDFKLDYNKLLEVTDKLKENHDIIYNKYLKNINKQPNDKRKWTDNGSVPPVIIDLLQGNFIISEFDEFLTDEFGNFITF